MISVLITLSWISLFIIFTKINNLFLVIYLILAGNTVGGVGNETELKISLFLLVLVSFATYVSLTTENTKLAYIIMCTINLVLLASIGFVLHTEHQASLLKEEVSQESGEKIEAFFSKLPKSYVYGEYESSGQFYSFHESDGLVFHVSYSPHFDSSSQGHIVINPFGKVKGKTIDLYVKDDGLIEGKYGIDSGQYYYKDKSGVSMLEEYEFTYSGLQNKQDYYIEEFKPYYSSEMNGVSSK